MDCIRTRAFKFKPEYPLILQRSVYIVNAVSLVGEQLFDTLAMISLQFNRIPFYCATAGKFSFHILREVFKVNISRVKSLNYGDFFTIPSFIYLDINPLLLLCYLLTNT